MMPALAAHKRKRFFLLISTVLISSYCIGVYWLTDSLDAGADSAVKRLIGIGLLPTAACNFRQTELDMNNLKRQSLNVLYGGQLPQLRQRLVILATILHGSSRHATPPLSAVNLGGWDLAPREALAADKK